MKSKKRSSCRGDVCVADSLALTEKALPSSSSSSSRSRRSERRTKSKSNSSLASMLIAERNPYETAYMWAQQKRRTRMGEERWMDLYKFSSLESCCDSAALSFERASKPTMSRNGLAVVSGALSANRPYVSKEIQRLKFEMMGVAKRKPIEKSKSVATRRCRGKQFEIRKTRSVGAQGVGVFSLLRTGER